MLQGPISATGAGDLFIIFCFTSSMLIPMEDL